MLPGRFCRTDAVNPPVKTKKKIHFEFDQDLVREPLLYKINRSFDVVVNIRGASVSACDGRLRNSMDIEFRDFVVSLRRHRDTAECTR